MSQQYIQVLRFWAQHQHTLGLPYDVATFDLPDAVYWTEKMQEDEEAGVVADNLIKPPKVFKKEEEWIAWSEQFIVKIMPPLWLILFGNTICLLPI